MYGKKLMETQLPSLEKTTLPDELNKFDDYLQTFKLESVKEDHLKIEEREDSSENDLDSLLEDFLIEMNK